MITPGISSDQTVRIAWSSCVCFFVSQVALTSGDDRFCLRENCPDITEIGNIAAVPGFTVEIQSSIPLFCDAYRGTTKRLCRGDFDIIDAEFFTDVFYLVSINHKMGLSIYFSRIPNGKKTR